MLLVGIGGFAGAVLRYMLGKWITEKTTTQYPFGTWVVNISGAFLLGLLVALNGKFDISEWIWLLLGVGFLGAYTTFSTFGYETIGLLQEKEVRAALVYVFSTVILCAGFAWLGGVVLQ